MTRSQASAGLPKPYDTELPVHLIDSQLPARARWAGSSAAISQRHTGTTMIARYANDPAAYSSIGVNTTEAPPGACRRRSDHGADPAGYELGCMFTWAPLVNELAPTAMSRRVRTIGHRRRLLLTSLAPDRRRATCRLAWAANAADDRRGAPVSVYTGSSSLTPAAA
jgi:hypothetical protein